MDSGKKRYYIPICIFIVLFIYAFVTIFGSSSSTSKREISVKQVLEHKDCKGHNLWLVINRQVYDVSDFIAKHPGGKAICSGAGVNSTNMFTTIHAEWVREKVLPKYCIGHIPVGEKMPDPLENVFVDGWHDQLPAHTHSHDNEEKNHGHDDHGSAKKKPKAGHASEEHGHGHQ